MEIYKGASSRDLICLDFDFGARSYEEEISHLHKILHNEQNDKKRESLLAHIEKAEKNKFKYCKRSKEEIRELFYENGVSVKYQIKDKNGNVKKEDIVEYKMI